MALNEENCLCEIKDEPEWTDNVEEPECYDEEMENSQSNESGTVNITSDAITSLDPNIRLKSELEANANAKAGPSAFDVGRLLTPDELQDEIDQMDPAIVASIAPNKLILNLAKPAPKKRPQPHPNDPRPRPYACTMCDYRTTQNAHLKRHITTHTGEKPFSCSLCPFQTSQNSNYTRHMLTHSGEKPFSCTVCDFRTGYSSALKEHMRIHTGEKPYKCNVCDYKCSHSAHLKRHLRTHTGERPYACKVCNYRSSDYSALKTHIVRTHSKEKPLVCGLCDFKTTDSTNFNRHKLTHSDDKVFTCDLCDYETAIPRYLTKHVRTHSGLRPFARKKLPDHPGGGGPDALKSSVKAALDGLLSGKSLKLETLKGAQKVELPKGEGQKVDSLKEVTVMKKEPSKEDVLKVDSSEGEPQRAGPLKEDS